METPTILYLNNRYVNSLKGLKAYIGSALSETQKQELVAAFRDKVIYHWLKEGGDAEKIIADKMQLSLDQHLGNGEILSKIAELLGVENASIADYKFLDYVEYLGCYPLVRLRQMDAANGRASDTNTPKQDDDSVVGTDLKTVKAKMGQLKPKLAEFAEEMSSVIKDATLVAKGVVTKTLIDKGKIPQDLILHGGTIRLKKGQKTSNVVFVFKIISPENDYLSLRFSLNPNIENLIVNDNLKLDLGGKKNSLRTVTLEIDGEKLPKESALAIYHGNDIIGRVNFDNHENTDKVIEATEEPVLEGYQKANIVARVRKQEGYWFYGSNAQLALKVDLKLLKNSMYPDLEFGFYYHEIQGKDKNKVRLYYVGENGCQELGIFSDATPLNEDLVAVRKNKDSIFFGIIDKTGKTILEDNKVGKIYGINKDGCLVCEVRPGTQGLANLKGEKVRKDKEFNHYFVNPFSDSICSYDQDAYGSLARVYFSSSESDSFDSTKNISFSDWKTIVSIYYFNSRLFIIGVDNGGETVYSGWFNGLPSVFCNVYETTCSENDLQIWLNKPLFPLFKADSKIYVSEQPDDMYVMYGYSSHLIQHKKIKPVFVSEKWMLEHVDGSWYIYENKENSFDVISRFTNIGDLFAVYCCSQGFVHFETNKIELIFIKDDLRPEKKEIINYNGIKKIETVVSYGNYIAIRYLYQPDGGNEETHCSLIITREGETVFLDEWNEFSYICGPFKNKYFYLNHGDLYCMDEDKKNKNKLTGLNADNLNASELCPLGTTGRFVVKNEKGYQIIDNKGNPLGKPFYEFNVAVTNCEKDAVMDYIYNSQYLPIKNEEGKCGLIDTNGNIIVPCEYDEVENLNSVFKKKGIVVF